MRDMAHSYLKYCFERLIEDVQKYKIKDELYTRGKVIKGITPSYEQPDRYVVVYEDRSKIIIDENDVFDWFKYLDYPTVLRK